MHAHAGNFFQEFLNLSLANMGLKHPCWSPVPDFFHQMISCDLHRWSAVRAFQFQWQVSCMSSAFERWVFVLVYACMPFAWPVKNHNTFKIKEPCHAKATMRNTAVVPQTQCGSSQSLPPTPIPPQNGSDSFSETDFARLRTDIQLQRGWALWH